MSSASDSHPWRITPPGRKPPPGPERSAWLESQSLFRNRDDIYRLLDDIDPALRADRPTELDPNAVSLAILEFLEQKISRGGQGMAALTILCHLNSGFKRYCRHHDVSKIQLPLVQDLGLDDGLLDGEVLASLALHRAIVKVWTERVVALLSSKCKKPHEVAAATVASAALFGGLEHDGFRKALVSALTKPCLDSGGFVRFELSIGSRKYRWLADPVTETLIRRWTSEGVLPLAEGSIDGTTFRTELAQYTPKSAIESRTRPINPAEVLSRASKGMLLHHFPPDIATIACGHVENTPLPVSAWSRLVVDQGRWPGDRMPPIRVQPKRSRREVRAIQDGFIWQKIHDLESGMKWSPQQRRSEGLTSSVKTSVREDYVSEAGRKIATVRRDVEAHYAVRGEDGSACFSRVLCQFAEDLTTRGGLIKEDLAPSTIESYFQDIKTSLAELAVSDVRAIAVDQRQNIYHQAVLRAPAKTREGLSVALHLFEGTLIRSFGIDDEVDWSALPMHSRISSSVDANLVDPVTYAALWQTLKTVPCDEEYRPIWISLALLLYRFGLRRGESHEVRLADIHLLSKGYVSLSVPVSQLTTNKSRQAKRRIGPVRLPPEELAVLQDLVTQRNRETRYRARLEEVYLFAWPGHGSQLLDEDTLFRPITELLHWVSGDNSLRIHHFRHAFASRLFCSGRVAVTSLDETPHRPAPWLAAFSRDGAWLRAYELGHVSPRESMTTYCHTADLVHHSFACAAVSAVLPSRVLSMLAGLGERSLERAILRQNHGNSHSARLLLETARRKWPLADAFESRREPRPIEVGQPSTALRLPPQQASHGFKMDGRFQDLLAIVRDRLCNRLDLSAWEQVGYGAPQIRGWIENIDRLSALGFLRVGRERRDRMPAELVQCGQRVLDAMQAEEEKAYVPLLARCLAGFGNGRQGIRGDSKTARDLKKWIEYRNDEMSVDLEPAAAGFTRVRLVGKFSISTSDEKLFFVVLAVRMLVKADIDVHVQPYRRLKDAGSAAPQDAVGPGVSSQGSG